MKKIFVLFLVMVLFVGAHSTFAAKDNGKSKGQGKSGAAHVRTTEQKKSDDIAILKQQIKEIQVSRKARGSTFKDTLRQGSKNNSIIMLQILLATDPSVYPEGKVTGYFGPLTIKAVKKFQAKHGLTADGVVGLKTKAVLESKLEEDNLSTETTGDGQERLCSIVPPGHLIAPGWLKQAGNTAPVVPTCQTLPPGIAKKLNLTPPPGADTTPPVISAISSSDITATTAIVHFTTDEATVGKVWFGTANPLDLGTATLVTDATSSTIHNVTLTALVPETAYYFVISATDVSANTSSSDQQSFTTGAGSADTVAPIISAVSANGITNTGATIIWTTDEPSSSKVYYGTGNPLDLNTSISQTTIGLSTNHSISLTGLTQNLTYYFVVESSDGLLNKAVAPQSSFTTTNN